MIDNFLVQVPDILPDMSKVFLLEVQLEEEIIPVGIPTLDIGNYDRDILMNHLNRDLQPQGGFPDIGEEPLVTLP